MKSEITLKAISSSGEPYDVNFNFSETQITVSCNCQAGMHGKLCKHKIGLLSGDASFLYDKSNEEILYQIHNEVQTTEYGEMISDYNNVKKEIDEAQRKEKKIRLRIENALKTGIKRYT